MSEVEKKAEDGPEAGAVLPSFCRNFVWCRADMQVPIEVVVVLEIAFHQGLAVITMGKEPLKEMDDLAAIFAVNQIRARRRHIDPLALVVRPALLIALREDRVALFLRVWRPAVVEYAPPLNGNSLFLAKGEVNHGQCGLFAQKCSVQHKRHHSAGDVIAREGGR
jgi:hypothetical protein